jgi:iron complex transport system substrate-binding protein
LVIRWAPLIALALTACAAAPAREAVPTTIVSLNPCTDAILAEVADPAQIAALSSYSSDPASSSMDVAKARRFRSVSGAAEEVAALRPALVIGSTFTAPAARAAFARMGLRFAAFGAASTVEESKAQVREIAALAGHPERGELLNAQIDAALAQSAPPFGPPVPAIVWQSGGMVPGQGTLIADLLARTGFSNASALRGLNQADLLPLEQMLAAPPRVIFTAGNPLANEDRLLAHPALRALSGTLRAPINPALLWCGGPSIPRTVARLAEVRRAL